jgi:hypothetical protein
LIDWQNITIPAGTSSSYNTKYSLLVIYISSAAIIQAPLFLLAEKQVPICVQDVDPLGSECIGFGMARHICLRDHVHWIVDTVQGQGGTF